MAATTSTLDRGEEEIVEIGVASEADCQWPI